jgi:dsDNA-specific endonuclease/ATPase MutS2
VASLKARTDALASEAEKSRGRLITTGQTGGARADARAAIDAIGDRLRSGGTQIEQPSAAVAGRPAAVGDRVVVGGLGFEGVVQAVHDRDAEVDVRGKRMRVALRDLRVSVPAAMAQGSSASRVRVNVELQPRDGLLSEINVIGTNVDEALTRTSKFLDDALVSEMKTLRIIHGYGTGQLRRAIGEYLHTHPLVASFAPAPADKGGGGVTIVELKD